MYINRKSISIIMRMIGTGVLIGILINFYFGWGNQFSWQNFFWNVLASVILTIVFWTGSRLIIVYLIKKYSWIYQTKRVAIIHIILGLVFSILVIFLFYLVLWVFVMHRKTLHGFFFHFKTGFFICLSLYLIVVLIVYSYYFFRSWRESLLNEERLKLETLALQYESLKNQVNPHFLFNSLNVLTSLIERDKDASIKYVKQLSDVFRYVLDQNVRELVPVETELKFIESYKFLQNIRFGNNFHIETNIKEKNFLMVPLALQILVENAVKHNEISTENPLTIHIYDDDDYLYISNNLQPRGNLPDSNQIGLKTLDFQYEFLAKRKMEVLNADNQFIVKLPKINT